MFDKMLKRALLLVVAGAAVAAVTGGPIGAQSSAPTASVAVDREVTPPPDAEAIPGAILYNQYNNPGANALTSQNFEAIYDSYDSFLADDFMAGTNQAWRITGVDVDGQYSVPGGPADSFNVFIHRNDPTNLPKEPAAITRLNQAYTLIGTNTFRITISPPMFIPRVGNRHLWISVQANMDAATNGQWFWTDRSVQSNTGAAWKNPGGGFGVGCLTYADMNGCLGTADPDLMFRISGLIAP
jgi:hypothetical protein